MELPGVLHLAFVRSPLASARIRNIHAPGNGALALLTAATIREHARSLPIMPSEGMFVADAPHPVLAANEVRYVGQPVAAVIAESRALAEDWAEIVQVDYEPLEPVLDPRGSEALLRWSHSSGDVEGIFDGGARRVHASFRIPRLAAAPLEPRGAAASVQDAFLTVWVSAQDPHSQRAGLADCLNRDSGRIRVVVPDVGGSFGSKGAISPETVVVAVAAELLGRPVKWIEDRAENFLAAHQGRGLQADVELALDDHGQFLGIRARLWVDLGAYVLPFAPVVAENTGRLLTGCYRFPAAEVKLVGARTNKVPTGPYRGAGRPEAAFLLEQIVDTAARELGLDPVELRRRNLIPREAFPYRTALGWTYDSGDYERCLDLAVELVEPERSNDSERVVGTGLAMFVEPCRGVPERAEARLEAGGRVVVRPSSTPHGQGHDTTFAQIAADELGLALDDVRFEFGDSALVPRGTGTFGSRSAAIGGSAVALACRRLREEAERQSGRRWEELDRDGIVGLRAEATFQCENLFSAGCYAAVVAIERATGVLHILRLAAVDDCGRVLNPLLAEGQVLGATVQGLGQCLSEEVVHDENGQPLTASFADYKLLTAAELPPIQTAFVETPSPYVPLGAKGVGEGGTIGAPAAIANAVADALGGVHLDPPFTPEKLWQALRP